jgi:cytochrome c554/c'-like protein
MMDSTRLLLALSIFWLAAPAIHAQDATAPKSSALHSGFVGATDCVKCHSNGIATDPTLEAVFPGMVNDRWVLLNEVRTWAASDKHVQAFTTLQNKRSKRMGELLGVKEIPRDKRCLACHTGFPLSAMGDDPHLMATELTTELTVAQGVSCEGCHGPARSAAGSKESWYEPHMAKEKWRFVSSIDKREQFGFTNVRSPVARTRLCLSCHLGNATEGKIVTHEMYAAGHPPLPGFELQSFVAQMPKHWREFHDKSDEVRTEFLEKNGKVEDVYGRESFAIDNLHESRNTFVAALVSYSENLKLSAALADANLKTPVTKPDWPELAQFECFACHHDLKDRGWRQRRALRGAPGRPMLKAWPTSLAKLALKTLGSDPNELDQRMQAVEKMLSEQPFGRRERWPEIVKPVTSWLDQQAAALERKPLPRAAGLSVLRDLCGIADSDLWDYDSARQLIWATGVLRRELLSDRSDESLRTRVAGLQAEMTEIERLVVLNLIDGRAAQQQLPGATKSREVREVDLEKTLPPIADYDAVTFRDRFRKLAAKLK